MSKDLTNEKATMPYQSAKNRFYGIWIRGEYSGNRFKAKYKAEAFAKEHDGHVRRFGYDKDGNMVQMKRPQVITEKMEQSW